MSTSDEARLSEVADSTFEIAGFSYYMPTLRRPEFSHLLYDLTLLPQILQAFEGLTDPIQLADVVADPNTSPERIAALAGLFPAEFCANPALIFLLLENPALPADMPAPSVGRLLAYPDLPSDFATAVARFGKPEFAAAARRHIALGGEPSADWFAELEQAVLEWPTLPSDDLLLVLVQLGCLPPWLRQRIAASDDAGLLAALDGLPPPMPDVLLRVTPQPAGTPDEVLLKLFDDENPRARVAAALCPSASAQSLQQMKQTEDWADVHYDVYYAIACNPNTDAATLHELTRDKTALAAQTRRAVARHPNATPEVLAQLVDEPYAADVRLALIAHPNVDPELRARMRLNSLHQALYSGDPIYRAIALSAPSTPTPELARGATSYSWLDRVAVALNPATPPALRAILAEDGLRVVRAAARQTPPSA